MPTRWCRSSRRAPFPNHVSLATCAPVDRHGIVANTFVDRERGLFDYSNDASWIEAEPLWVAAERQGVRTATFFWVGSETPWQGVAATYHEAPFDTSVTEAEKVDRILGWLDLPPAERPRLVMSWWHGADAEGHAHGPDAPETREALRGQDHELGRLLAGLDARGAWPTTTLLLVSDHGMTEQGGSVDPMDVLAERGIAGRFVSGGPFGHVFLDDPAQAGDAAAALDALDHVEAWTRDALPERFRYRYPQRTGDVFVLAEPPLRLGGGSLLQDLRFAIGSLLGRTLGAHGYDPERSPEMRAHLPRPRARRAGGRAPGPAERPRRRAHRRAPARHRAAEELRGQADRGDRRAALGSQGEEPPCDATSSARSTSSSAPRSAASPRARSSRRSPTGTRAA